MNPTHSSSVGEVFNKGRKLRLLIGVWEESSFSLAVPLAFPPPGRVEPDWENIEAVGAADDATRFHTLSFPLPEYVRNSA